MENLIAKMSQNNPATPVQIEKAEKYIGKKFPREYLDFLGVTNGAEGFIGEEYLVMWRVEDIPERNTKYDIEKFCPGLIVFGTDGGGETFGFDIRNNQWSIVRIPTVPMSWEDAVNEGDTFSDFLQKLSRKL